MKNAHFSSGRSTGHRRRVGLRRRLLLVLLSVAGTVGLLSVSVQPASAMPVPLGEWNFAVSRPSYKRTDVRTTFNAQVNTSKSSRTMAWSLKLSPGLRVLSTGKMKCVTTVVGHKGYRDEHLVSTSYLLHSSVPGNKFNRKYVLNGTCVFPVKVGSRTGTATLEYAFNYSLYSIIASRVPSHSLLVGSAAAKKGVPMVSSVKYRYRK